MLSVRYSALQGDGSLIVGPLSDKTLPQANALTATPTIVFPGGESITFTGKEIITLDGEAYMRLGLPNTAVNIAGFKATAEASGLTLCSVDTTTYCFSRARFHQVVTNTDASHAECIERMVIFAAAQS